MTATTSATRAVVLLAVCVLASWARDIPDWARLKELQDEREMHPGVTRRTREVRYTDEENHLQTNPPSLKSPEPPQKSPALSEEYSNFNYDHQGSEEDAGLFGSLVLLLLGSRCHDFTQTPARQKGGKEKEKVEEVRGEARHYIRPRERVRMRRGGTKEEDADFWTNNAQVTLKEHLAERPVLKKAKNVILFLGDGMSIPTLTAARIRMGQKDKKDGEETQLSFEKFPITGLSKTYCVDTQVADSACSATAYLTGVKNNEGTIGVTGAVKKGNCTAMNDVDNHLDSILLWSQEANKKTGIVTTTRITHASPAGTYAHTAHRDWESDSNVVHDGQDPTVCQDIAYQLVHNKPGKDIHVILGGGRSEFRSNSVLDEEGTRGYRVDRQDLIKQWQTKQKDAGRKAEYVWNKKDLLAVKPDETEYLLGLFEGDHTRYHMDIDPEVDPTLEEMTLKAIELLENENGYFLFVEGGRIDHAHHSTLAQKALDETIQLSLAVEAALKKVNEDDTLIVVTSDHAHTMSIAGYPDRGSDILGVYGMSSMDHKPFSTLAYSNGPGYKIGKDGSRYNMTVDDTQNKEYEFPSMVPLSSETHGGDDVAVFAKGPYSHLFTGMYEQNLIPHIMAYASCVGHGDTLCNARNKAWNWRS